jgi:hypothetical protein
MAITRLAVSTPNSGTDTLIHSSDRNAIVSVIAANTSGSAATIRAWAVPSGAVSASAYAYYAFDSVLPGNNTLETFRFAIEDGDNLYVRASTSFVSFSLNGIYESNGTSNITVASLSASPTSSVIGDVWLDSTNNVVYFWSGSTWLEAVGGSSVAYSSSSPSNPDIGTLWVDSDGQSSLLNADDFLLNSTASATYATKVELDGAGLNPFFLSFL